MDVIKDIFNPKKPAYNPQLSKVNLKLALKRIDIQKKKKVANNDAKAREIAVLLSEGKEETAVIKIQTIIREEKLLEAFGILEIDVEHLLLRVDSINLSSVAPPPDVIEPLMTVIYASQRVDIKELKNLNSNWKLKYGQEFLHDSFSNRRNLVKPRIVELLSYQRPSNYVMYRMLDAIAKKWSINWSAPEEYLVEEMDQTIEDNSTVNVTIQPRNDPPKAETWVDDLNNIQKLSNSTPIPKGSNYEPQPEWNPPNSTNNHPLPPSSTPLSHSVPVTGNSSLPVVPEFAGFDDEEDFELDYDTELTQPDPRFISQFNNNYHPPYQTQPTSPLDKDFDSLAARLNALKK
eukprot:TRINITY_DN12066_c0_g1_i1.p1 TRINITY_DN12066_c0_g1~~TRINITY_DN12066_c0_g1_i1.p1  ORF type:complete len:347 (-),score=91.92 TRINITY_DN12066_c0_g1_i1:5-1045(-)